MRGAVVASPLVETKLYAPEAPAQSGGAPAPE